MQVCFCPLHAVNSSLPKEGAGPVWSGAGFSNLHIHAVSVSKARLFFLWPF